MNRFSITIKIIILLFLVSGAVYTFNRLDFFKEQTSTLTVQKTGLIKVNEYLEQSLDKEKKDNAAKGVKVDLLLRELAGLQDTKRIKEENARNQEKLRSVNTDYIRVKKETSKLKQANLSLNHRLTKLTNEFTKTFEEINRLQTQINESKSDKFVRKFVLQLKKTEVVLQKREKELKDLKGKNKILSSESAGFNKEKKILKKNVMRLEKENTRLEALVNKIRSDFNEQQRVKAKLKEDIRRLSTSLRTSETEKFKFDQQIEILNARKEILARKLDFQGERITELEDELLDIEKKARQIRKIEQARDDLAAELKQAQKKMKDQGVIRKIRA